MNPRNIVVTYGLVLLLTILALVVIKELNISYPLQVRTSTASGELAVVGEGSVEVTPDTAFVDVGITVADEPSAPEVEVAINKANNAIVAALKGVGIPTKDIKTSNYTINPNYTYDAGGPGRITGYTGTATLTIKVAEKDKLAEVTQAALKAGANQILSTRYDIDKPEKYRQEARNKAIANAKDQASNLAQNLGIKLGRVVNIVESSPSDPSVFNKSYLMEAGGGAPAPDLQAGTQTVSSVVTLYFEKR